MTFTLYPLKNEMLRSPFQIGRRNFRFLSDTHSALDEEVLMHIETHKYLTHKKQYRVM